jgi:hypothetical protein
MLFDTGFTKKDGDQLVASSLLYLTGDGEIGSEADPFSTAIDL